MSKIHSALQRVQRTRNSLRHRLAQSEWEQIRGRAHAARNCVPQDACYQQASDEPFGGQYASEESGQRQPEDHRAQESDTQKIRGMPVRSDSFDRCFDELLAPRVDVIANEVVARIRQKLEQQLLAMGEASSQMLAQPLRAEVTALGTQAKQVLSEFEQRSQEWSRNITAQEIRLQRLLAESTRISQNLQQELDRQLRHFQTTVHDTLVDASGQLKGRLQYALEYAQALLLEEQGSRGGRENRAHVSGGTQQLGKRP